MYFSTYSRDLEGKHVVGPDLHVLKYVVDHLDEAEEKEERGEEEDGYDPPIKSVNITCYVSYKLLNADHLHLR